MWKSGVYHLLHICHVYIGDRIKSSASVTVTCFLKLPCVSTFAPYQMLQHKENKETCITLLCMMAIWPTWAVRSQPSEQCTRTDVLWFSTLSTIRTAPAKMHLICFNQYVDSTPDNHLDSSMLGKHNSVTNDTNKQTVNVESEHYNTQNTSKQGTTVHCGIAEVSSLMGCSWCTDGAHCHLQGQAVWPDSVILKMKAIPSL